MDRESSKMKKRAEALGSDRPGVESARRLTPGVHLLPLVEPSFLPL